MPRKASTLSSAIDKLEETYTDSNTEITTLIKDEVKKNISVRIVDDNDFYKPKTQNRKIVLKPIDERHARNNIATVLRPVMDRYGRLLTGQPEFTEEEKNKVLKVVTYDTTKKLVGTVVMDLSNPIDAIDWEWMQYHPYIAKSKEEAEKSIDARYYIEDIDKENDEYLKRKKHEVKVSTAILELSMTKKRKLARVLGYLITNVSDAEIERFLLEATSKDYSQIPEKQILTLLGDENKLNFLFLAYTLIDRGEILFDMGTYKYKGSMVGSSFDEYVSWLSHPDRSSFVVLMTQKYVV